jgi:hypothetical protein
MAGAASGPWRPIRRHGVGLETALDTLRRWSGLRFMALAGTQTTAVSGCPRMSPLGYNSPSEPPIQYVWNDPSSGPSEANFWNPVVFVRFTPKSGSAGRYRHTESFDPERSLS